MRRMVATNARAWASEGSDPAVSVTPKVAGSRASGIRKVRVTLLRTGSTAKSVRSQVVAATLSRASRASVPTHGRLTFGTIGRSTLASRPGTSPTGTGATSSVSGVVAQPSPCGVGHMPLTARTSIRYLFIC